MSTSAHPHLRRHLAAGDLDAWCRDLDALCQHVVRRATAPHWDEEDLMQEARAALVKAFRTYDHSRGANPLTWAKLIVERQVWRILQRDLQMGRKGALEADRLDAPVDARAGDLTLGEVAAAGVDVQAQAMVAVELAEALDALARLPARERQALLAVVFGERPVGDRTAWNVRTRARQRLREEHDRQPGRCSVIVARDLYPDEHAAMAAAGRLLPGWTPVRAARRKWLNGDRDGRGRSTKDGRLGVPTWRVDLTRDPDSRAG